MVTYPFDDGTVFEAGSRKNDWLYILYEYTWLVYIFRTRWIRSMNGSFEIPGEKLIKKEKKIERTWFVSWSVKIIVSSIDGKSYRSSSRRITMLRWKKAEKEGKIMNDEKEATLSVGTIKRYKCMRSRANIFIPTITRRWSTGRCLEDNRYWKRRRTETEQSGWLSDYPILRNICNLRLEVPSVSTPPSGSFLPLHPSLPFRLLRHPFCQPGLLLFIFHRSRSPIGLYRLADKSREISRFHFPRIAATSLDETPNP